MPRRNKKVFSDLTFNNGVAELSFQNGYSVKVETHTSATTYGAPYEVTCIPTNNRISDEPIGYCTEEEVSQIMKEIQGL